MRYLPLSFIVFFLCHILILLFFFLVFPSTFACFVPAMWVDCYIKLFRNVCLPILSKITPHLIFFALFHISFVIPNDAFVLAHIFFI